MLSEHSDQTLKDVFVTHRDENVPFAESFLIALAFQTLTGLHQLTIGSQSNAKEYL